MFQSSCCMNHFFGSWEKTASSVCFLRTCRSFFVCGAEMEFFVFLAHRSSRTCMALFVCLPLGVMLLQKTIAADTVTVCASYLRVSFFYCCCSRHACGLACVVFSRVLLRRYRSACYISAACMRFARLYIALHTCGISMRIRYDLL